MPAGPLPPVGPVSGAPPVRRCRGRSPRGTRRRVRAGRVRRCPRPCSRRRRPPRAERDEASADQAPAVHAVPGVRCGGTQDDTAPGLQRDAHGEDAGEFGAFGRFEPVGAVGAVVRAPGGVQDREEPLVLGGGGAHQVVGARPGRLQQSRQQVGGPVEGGSADVLPAVTAVPEVGEEHRGVLPGRPADGRGDQERDQRVDGLARVRHGGTGGGDFRGEAAATLAQVGVEAHSGAELRVVLGIEERDGGVLAARGEHPEEPFDLPEVDGVVVEGEAAVAAHGREVLGVHQEADGAGCFAAQRAPRGRAGPVAGRCGAPAVLGAPVLPGVRHESPCAWLIDAHSA